jgi:hypothetical protein
MGYTIVSYQEWKVVYMYVRTLCDIRSSVLVNNMKVSYSIPFLLGVEWSGYD